MISTKKIAQRFVESRRLCFLLLALAAGSVALAQTNLPQIIPPSPVAQTMMRYGEIPVSYSTGVPGIDIPIYTLEGRKLKVPISISYHASGIKVNDIASEVGLGWALNAGGLTTRTTNAQPDNATYKPKTYTSSTQLMSAANNLGHDLNLSCNCYASIANFESYLTLGGFQGEDPISDRYSYRFPDGSSGVFTYDNTAGNLITMPYRPIKIERIVDPSTSRIDKVRITDENGIVYLFEFIYSSWPSHYSEWYLTKMTSADGLDEIDFNYQTALVNTSLHTINFAMVTSSDDVSIDCYGLPYFPVTNLTHSFSPETSFNTPVLSSIVSSKAVVTFEYSTREDFSALRRLTQITVTPAGAPTQIIKRIQFNNNSYFGTQPEDKRLKLDGVAISAGSDPQAQVQNYYFTYESQSLPGYPGKMATPQYNEDFWGYNNGTNSQTLLESDFITDASNKQLYGGHRAADPTGLYSKACMLKEIKYPTGGKTVFSFERNYASGVYQYKYDASGFVGGFRVGSITNYSAENTIASIKTYEYQFPVVKPVQREYFWQMEYSKRNNGGYTSPAGGQTYCMINTTTEILSSSPALPLEVAPGMPIMYQKVIEYNGTKANNAGKTVYYYNQPYSASDYIDNPDHPSAIEQPQAYNAYNYDKGNYVPEINSKTEYSFDGTNYHPLLRELFHYTPMFTTSFTTGINLTRSKTFANVDVASAYDPLAANNAGAPQDYINSIVVVDTKAYQEASLLTNHSIYTFDPLDSTKYSLTSTDYTYNQFNLAVKEKSMLSSKGDLLKTSYTYPNDFQSTAPYSTMVNKQILHPVIEQWNYRNGQFLDLTRTHYKDWGNNIIEPDYVQTQLGATGPLETRINYLSYETSYGNLTKVQKKNDVLISYIWGYDGSYPVAEIKGCDYETASSYVNLSLLNNAVQYSDVQVRTELDKIRVGLTALKKPFSLATMTFKPAVGLTSQTDSNGISTFFEYDNFGRLVNVKDYQGNVVKNYEYHFVK